MMEACFDVQDRCEIQMRLVCELCASVANLIIFGEAGNDAVEKNYIELTPDPSKHHNMQVSGAELALKAKRRQLSWSFPEPGSGLPNIGTRQ